MDRSHTRGTRPASANAGADTAKADTVVITKKAMTANARQRPEPLAPTVLPNLTTIPNSQHDRNESEVAP